jgi:hypothetical protein
LGVNWVFGIAVLGGILAILGAITGLVARAGRLTVDHEFPALSRPETLTDFPFVTIIVAARNEERDPAMLPEVAAAEAGFRQGLRDRGVGQRPLADVQTTSTGIRA